VLAAMLLASGLVFASTTSVTTALPDIARSLRATQTQVSLIADAYPVILGALVLPMGALLDRHGRRRGMVLGLLVLAASQLWSAGAGSATDLVLGRILSGIGAAAVLPGTLATITAVTPDDRRGRAVAAWTGGVMVGASLGMLIAGAAADWTTWRATFVAVAALALLIAAATATFVPETSEASAPRVDAVGAVLVCLAIGGLVLGTIESPARSIGDGLVLVSLLGGSLALAALVWWELRVAAAPLLDLRLFADRGFAMGNATLVVLYAAVFGWFFLAFQYFAFVRGYGAIHTGVALLPCVIGVVPLSLAATRVAERFGRARVIAVALIVMAAGTGLMALAADTGSWWPLAVAFLVFGVGVGLGSTPPTEAIIEALPRERQGIASAANDAAREIGAALGIAALASLFNAGYRARVHALLAVSSLPGAQSIRSTPAAALHHARAAAIVREGIVSGWRVAFIATSAILVLMVPVVLRLARSTDGAPRAAPAQLSL
jgi:MFS family permease